MTKKTAFADETDADINKNPATIIIAALADLDGVAGLEDVEILDFCMY